MRHFVLNINTINNTKKISDVAKCLGCKNCLRPLKENRAKTTTTTHTHNNEWLPCLCVYVCELFVNRKRLLWFVRQTRRHIANVYAAGESVRNTVVGAGRGQGCRGGQTEFYVAS